MRVLFAWAGFLVIASSAAAQSALDSVKVGPWKIATTYEADNFKNCTMSRSTPKVDIVLERNAEGLLLKLDSNDWKLERGKAYTVTLSAGSRAIDAKALAETQSVTIALAERSFNKSLATANFLNVKGESASIGVPLDGSAAALGRLEQCFEENAGEGSDSNPFEEPK